MYRYIGNKTRLVPWLLSRIRRLAPTNAVIADPMCGTASVSEALRIAGYRVFASDIMTYAIHHARVRLLLDGQPRFHSLGQSYPEVLSELNQLPVENGLFFREYSPEGQPLSGNRPRQYLSAQNAGRIDAISRQIRQWYEVGLINELENSLLRHDLILATNRVANIAGTYGHFRSKWSGTALAQIELVPSQFFGSRTDHTVMQGPAEDIAGSIIADVCYIDPPYMKRQYGANYHLIETIARGDEPEAVGASGLRPWRDQYSVFCTRTRIKDAFQRLIEQAVCPIFLISYSSDGLLSESEMTEMLSVYGEISVEKIKFPRFRSNNSALGSHVEEYLITLKKSCSATQQRHVWGAT